jgi:drug/metabolite transporter (DMT)-like permease
VIANLMARAMYGTRFPVGMGLALLLVVGGAVLVIHGNPQNAGRSLSLQGGEILIVLAQVSWIWYSLKVTEWRPAADAVRATTLTSAAAAVWLVLAYLVVAATGVLDLYAAVPTTETGALLLLAGAGSAGIAVVLWNYGASVMGVPLASLYLNLVPVVAVALSVAMGSTTSLEQLSGGLLVILGVLQVQVRRLRAAAA